MISATQDVQEVYLGVGGYEHQSIRLNDAPTQTREASKIETQLGATQAQISRLQHNFMELRERLGVVLLPAMPTEESKSNSVEVLRSPLEQQMWEQGKTLWYINSAVEELINRLTV